LEKTFNQNWINESALIPVVVSGNITALNDQEYTNVASATYTDPSPVEGKGFTVTVRNGTATVGGTAYAIAGTVIKRIFHSGAWANNVLYPQVQGSNIASATTVNLANATGNSVTITGTTTITGLGTVAAGTVFNLTFSGILTLTHNATSLILPTGANIATNPGDVAQFVSLGSGNWKCIGYLRANGRQVAGDSNFLKNNATNPFISGFALGTVGATAAMTTPSETDIDFNTGETSKVKVTIPEITLGGNGLVLECGNVGSENIITVKSGAGTVLLTLVNDGTDSFKIGFFGATPVAQPNGVSAADALNALGLGTGII
jgi:hypothetical protein